MNRDQKFFDMYSLVIGVLGIFALLIFVGSMMLSDMTQGIYTADTAEYQAAVEERIRPLGRIYLPGEEAAAGEPQVAAAAQPEPVATSMSGPQVYNEACLVCHGSGVGGAPVVGDEAAWAARLAQGADTLYLHALEGFTGQTGYMPPRGARMDLTDDEIRAAVDYIMSESGS
ncbi:MAG: c-type cytochrome [Gammaproteobacteria bacterium]|nr:c-type cytochrome [Gammaproteobacteria bacterium]